MNARKNFSPVRLLGFVALLAMVALIALVAGGGRNIAQARPLSGGTVSTCNEATFKAALAQWH